MKLKHQEFIPEDHTCLNCGKVKGETNFATVKRHGRRYPQSVCSKCLYAIYHGYAVKKPKVVKPKPEPKLTVKQKIDKYFKEQ